MSRELLERIARGETHFDGDERETIDALIENGFVVESRDEERAALGEYFTNVREDTDQMRVTVLTTLQCNFACDYCFQGDHGDYNKFAAKMTPRDARKVALWIEQRLDEVKPGKFLLTLFGGEPLLNLPVGYYLAERTHALCAERGIPQSRLHHHERPAADAGGGRSAASVRSLRRQDHARRRPRHAQPDAPAARPPGDVRSDHRERPPRRPKGSDHDRRQLRREQLGQLPGAAASS